MERDIEEGLNYLQTFNPVESNAQLLEKTLIGRREVVDLLEKLVIESATSGNKHQRLIIGPRGSGKTHLLRVLYNRLSNRKELQDKLKIAYLCEDEYGVASFLDFIIRIFRAFIKWDEKNSQYLVNEIDQLKKTSVHEQEKIAVKILLDHIQEKTLLIIAENIGNIFAGIGKEGQAKLRDLVNQHPYFTIMASNQALFADVQFEDRPFHNFFAIIHLKKLAVEEAILFLQTIAQWEGKTDLLEFLGKPEGRGRIRAIYDITGGNHRLLVTFYNFLKVEYKNNLSHSFIKTINDLIPYYQSFMNLLSAQQQKIVQYLCQNRKPINVKEIAENCFTTHNTISKQMLNLVKLKYVDATPSGKQTYYELSEPLLRICYEVKENRGGPIKLFIDFLGNLYTVQEIKKRYMQFHLFAELLKGGKKVDFPQEQLYYKEAVAYQKMGEIEKGIEKAESLLKENENNIEALLLYADALKEKGEWRKAAEYYQKILKIEPKNYSVRTKLGESQFHLGEINDAVTNMFKALQLNKDNHKEYMTALRILYKNSEKIRGDIENIIKDNPDDPEAIMIISSIYHISGDFEKAIPFYEKQIDVTPEDPKLHFDLAECFTGLNNIPPALFHLEKALKLLDTHEMLKDVLVLQWIHSLKIIFVFGTIDNISRYLRESLSLVEKFNHKEKLLTYIPDVIFRLIIQGETMEDSRLVGIEAILTEIFQDEKDMIFPLKILNIGIRHLKKKEKNVLLQFTKEERKIFKKFILSDELSLLDMVEENYAIVGLEKYLEKSKMKKGQS